MTTNADQPQVASQFVPLGEAAPDAAADDQAASIMADMAGGADAGADSGAASKRFRVSSQLVLMVSVLVLSAAALYLMRKLGTGAGMTFVAVPVDYALEQAPPDRLADHRRLLAVLEASGITVQIPPDEVEKNPFHLVVGGDPDDVDIESLDPDEQERVAAEMRRRQAEQLAKKIQAALDATQVNSILTGSRPIANVNGKLVGIGDTIEDVLTVVEIHDRSLVVEADGERHTIEMQEKSTQPGRRPRRR